MLLASCLYGVSQIPALWSVDPRMSLFGYPGVYSGSVLTGALCISGLLLANRLDDEKSDALKRSILAFGSLTVLVVVAQATGAIQEIIGRLNVDQRVGFIGSKMSLGAMMVVLWGISKNPAYLLGAVLSGSRAAILGLLVASFPERMRFPAFAIICSLAVSFSLLCSRYSDYERKQIWLTAISGTRIFGSGPATFSCVVKKVTGRDDVMGAPNQSTADAHNSVLGMVCALGVFCIPALAGILMFPEMAGLWACSLFNPISFEVVFVACILVGLRRRKEGFLCAGLS